MCHLYVDSLRQGNLVMYSVCLTNTDLGTRQQEVGLIQGRRWEVVHVVCWVCAGIVTCMR